VNRNLELLLQLEECMLLARGLEVVGQGADAPGAECLEAKIEKLRRRLPGRVLSLYDRLARQYPNVVAVIANGICQGCQGAVSRRSAARPAGSNEIVQCEHCGRILLAKQAAPDYVS
jgi:predicted  nucleic acid-binding Zn-ribbon protein